MVDTFLYIGLHNAVLATLLALLVAGIGYGCRRRPALLHSLWLLVLLKLLTPPLLIVPLPGLTPLEVGNAEEMSEITPTRLEEPSDRRNESVTRPTPTVGEGFPVEPLVPQEETPTSDRPSSTAKPVSPGRLPDWKLVLCLLWVTGTLLWWMLALVRLRRFHRLLLRADPAPDSLQQQVQEVARRLGLSFCPEVRLLPGQVSPLLWALGRTPYLLIPSGLWDRLGEQQRQTLLAHELAHLRRGDHWVRCLELLVLGLYWWHPVVWWARWALQQAEEECCDAWVVWAFPESVTAYAEALLDTVAFLSESRPALPLGASGMGQMHLVKRRLIMIVRGTTPKALSRLGFGMILVLGAALLLLWPTWAQTEPPQEKPRTKPAPRETRPSDPTRPSRFGHTAPKTTNPTQPAVDPFGPGVTAPARPGVTVPVENRGNLKQELAQARAEVDLWKVRLLAKRAELEEVQARFAQATSTYDRYKRLRGQGQIPEEEVEGARFEVEVQKARLRGKEALLQEAELLLQQAQRRLSHLESLKKASGDTFTKPTYPMPTPKADPTLVKAAQQAYEDTLKAYQAGAQRMDAETLYRWSRRWLDAERSMSEKTADQTAAYKAHLQRMHDLHKLVNEFFKAGQVTRAAVAATVFYVAEAEQWHERLAKP